MMEWNSKSPLQWDWENLVMFNSKATEYPKKSRPLDWVIDGEGSADFGAFYSPPEGRVGGPSGSDVGHVSSKSSKSASINSSPIGEMKTSKFSLEAFNGVTEEFSNVKDFTKSHMTDTSPTLETSVGSGESLLGLKLGRQTYFEDALSLTAIPMAYEIPTKKSKTKFLSLRAQRCQVEGCSLDLSSAKDYHRKHRVCENHSKSPIVIIGGQERRFCQQCSRFHGLSEFDEKKRSCRRRLSDHNARRRKPHPEAVRLNQERLSSSFNGMRQQMNLVLNRAPSIHARAATTLSWESNCLPAFTQAKGYPLKPPKPGLIDGLTMSFAGNELPDSCLLPDKAATAMVLKGGFEEPRMSSNPEATQDLHRALSLLSTDSWPSYEPKITSLAAMQARSFDRWYAAQEQPEAYALASQDGANRFQEFQLLKAPCDRGFYPQ